MKKILMALTIALVAIGVNAATVDWKITCEWVTQSDLDEDTTLGGYLGYMFDGTTYTQLALQTALTTTGTTVLSSALGHSAVTSGGELIFTGSGLTYDDTVDPAYAKALLVIIDSAASEGSAFTVASFSNVKVTDAVKSGGAEFGAGLDLITGPTTSWSTVAVPEPTSGLLLVVGGALLALRRRRLA